jgi:hypothetical protein
VHILASTGSAWSYGGAVLTFLFPMILFMFIGAALYVVFSMPTRLPGSGIARERAAGATWAVSEAAYQRPAGGPPTTSGGAAASGETVAQAHTSAAGSEGTVAE